MNRCNRQPDIEDESNTGPLAARENRPDSTRRPWPARLTATAMTQLALPAQAVRPALSDPGTRQRR